MALVATPFLAQADYQGKRVSVDTTVLTFRGPVKRTIELSEQDVADLVDYVKDENIQSALEVAGNPEAGEDEKTWAEEVIEAFLEKLQNLNLLPDTFPIASFIGKLFSPKVSFLLPVLSFGHGSSWIPLYPGEAFLGFMLRPIFMNYVGPFGYSGSLNVKLIPPRIEYWDMVGTHVLCVLGFVGVYIDLGQIGFGIPNFQFLAGEALLAGGWDLF
jgi:hypothetical protein